MSTPRHARRRIAGRDPIRVAAIAALAAVGGLIGLLVVLFFVLMWVAAITAVLS